MNSQTGTMICKQKHFYSYVKLRYGALSIIVDRIIRGLYVVVQICPTYTLIQHRQAYWTR